MSKHPPTRARGAKAPVRLVCLDFDGTIMCYDEAPGFFHPAVTDLLNELDGRGISWCTNSGRDFDDQMRVLDATMHLGLRHKPAGLLCSEALVYERRNAAYTSAEPWNSRAFADLCELHRRVQDRLAPELEGVVARYGKCQRFTSEHFTAFCVEDRQGLPVRLHEELQERLAGITGFRISRNGGWVAVIHESLGKGAILREFGARAGFHPGEILAVGDHFNDLAMLSGEAAAHVGCPANSIPEVMEAVRTAGGYVAKGDGPLGTVEAIRHFI
jgi:hydroxymethylpyrimidine pyrophosphatase-like HAD family hydrolase